MNKTEIAIIRLITQGYGELNNLFYSNASKLIQNNLKELMHADNISFEKLNEEKWHISQLLSDLAYLLSIDVIESRHAKKILYDAWNAEPYAWDICWYLSDTKLLDETNSHDLDKMILTLLEKNDKVCKDILNGKEKAVGSLIGPIMKETKGKADPKYLKQRIIELTKEKYESI